MINSYQIAELAVKSLLYEVAATPKPGLVDRANSGAHSDMDYFTFLDSSVSLYQTFIDLTTCGFNHCGDSVSLLNELRIIGLEGEKRMFRVTNQVNTHKGAVFSLGLTCGAVGKLLQICDFSDLTAELIQNKIKQITKGLCAKDFANLNALKITHGEFLHNKYGTLGVRGEAEAGFPIVFDYSLPYMIKNKTLPTNDLLVNTLLLIISKLDDSTILWRHSNNVLEKVKFEADNALQLGGMTTDAGKKYILELDKNYIAKGISPGGAADMLALTIFVKAVVKKY